MTNAKKKGKRGELECRDVWRKHGYADAHRSQQFSGKGESSADLEGIDPDLHIECKLGYQYKSSIYKFMEQAKADAKDGQIPIVNCRMDREEWLCVLRLEDFIEIWKGRKMSSYDRVVYCDVVDCCEECPMYGDDCDGDMTNGERGEL